MKITSLERFLSSLERDFGKAQRLLVAGRGSSSSAGRVCGRVRRGGASQLPRQGLGGWAQKESTGEAPAVRYSHQIPDPVNTLPSVPEEKYLTLEGFHKFVVDRAKQDIRSVWRAILSCGYDLHFER